MTLPIPTIVPVGGGPGGAVKTHTHTPRYRYISPTDYYITYRTLRYTRFPSTFTTFTPPHTFPTLYPDLTYLRVVVPFTHTDSPRPPTTLFVDLPTCIYVPATLHLPPHTPHTLRRYGDLLVGCRSRSYTLIPIPVTWNVRSMTLLPVPRLRSRSPLPGYVPTVPIPPLPLRRCSSGLPFDYRFPFTRLLCSHLGCSPTFPVTFPRYPGLIWWSLHVT